MKFETTPTGTTSRTERMRISASGNVGIGLAPTTYQLELSTDSAAKPGTATWTVPSDSRLKDIRAPFSRGLAALEELNPIYYSYKKDNALKLPSDKEYVGIIAQDAQKAIPEAVKEDDKGYLTVTTDAIIWTLLNAIKELYHKVIEQFASVNREIDLLKAENQKLKNENNEIKNYLCAKDSKAPFCSFSQK
ncbi:MAG: tail fiber domain-containing protein [Bdellovibrionota bacterium]